MPGPLWRRAPAGTDVLPGTIVGEAPGVWSHAPLVACAFVCLGLAGVVNLVNLLQTGGIVPATGDWLFATLGLFGFVLPLALAICLAWNIWPVLRSPSSPTLAQPEEEQQADQSESQG